MQILIEKLKIKLLLEQKREYIGGVVANSFSFLLAVVSLGYSLHCKGNISGLVDWCLVAICVITGTMSIKMLCRDMFRNYTHQDLYDDIVKLDVITHPFSLVIIRNEFEKRPNKFLLRYNERWNCWLLPYYKTTSDDVEHLRQCLSEDLDVDANVIVRKERKIYEKFSPTAGKGKVYDHTFYYAPVKLQRCHKQDEFTIGGAQYKWFSIADMQADENIMKMNSDVIAILQTLTY